MQHRVVITGLGTVNPTGLTVAESWDNIVNGRTGIAPITSFDNTDYLVRVAGEVKNFDPTRYMEAREVRRRDRFQQLATAASKEALAQSGLPISEENAHRIAVVVSSSIGGVHAFQDAVKTIMTSGPRRVNPFTIPMLMPNGASGLIAIDNGLRGPNF